MKGIVRPAPRPMSTFGAHSMIASRSTRRRGPGGGASAGASRRRANTGIDAADTPAATRSMARCAANPSPHASDSSHTSPPPTSPAAGPIAVPTAKRNGRSSGVECRMKKGALPIPSRAIPPPATKFDARIGSGFGQSAIPARPPANASVPAMTYPFSRPRSMKNASGTATTSVPSAAIDIVLPMNPSLSPHSLRNRLRRTQRIPWPMPSRKAPARKSFAAEEKRATCRR